MLMLLIMLILLNSKYSYQLCDAGRDNSLIVKEIDELQGTFREHLSTLLCSHAHPCEWIDARASSAILHFILAASDSAGGHDDSPQDNAASVSCNLSPRQSLKHRRQLRFDVPVVRRKRLDLLRSIALDHSAEIGELVRRIHAALSVLLESHPLDPLSLLSTPAKPLPQRRSAADTAEVCVCVCVWKRAFVFGLR
jgi:hypothetical protein